MRNHARKADARRRTAAGDGSHRRTAVPAPPRRRVATGLSDLDDLRGGGLSTL
ncbi:hypothetical protein [Streptomyces graminofaciens]|uniref:hypothetical protein n=1 Tax=Streptomyces graminofaciens TaxID=68212 RepID=UPI00257439D2|nr:hypothetical protein [Streptomyces graminofaciens]